jgi:hypothetical protein
MPNYTSNLNLEKPLQSENYNVDVFNTNADKIDQAIQEVKGKVDGLELKAEKVTLADESNLFNASNVEDALLENKNSILANTQLINTLSIEVNGQRSRAINIHNQLESLL